MKVAACILMFNPKEFGRLELFDRTLASLKAGGVDVYVVDNGSTDGHDRPVSYRNTSTLTTSGYGTNLCARVLAATDADICVLSDDDIDWRPGWVDKLTAWWAEAPDDIWLTGCHIEPVFKWNAILDDVEFGGVRGLIRESTGAATWSFRRSDFAKLFPIPQQVQGWGDVPACDRTYERGGRVAQIDLATHEGAEASTWGNITLDKYGWDVEPVLARLK